MKRLQQFPWYLWLIGSYPIWYLYAQNIAQIDPATVTPIWAVTMLIISAAFLLLRTLLKSEIKSAIIVGMITIGFFTYGHVYNVLSDRIAKLPSHTFLIVVYSVIVLLLMGLALRSHERVRGWTGSLNLVALVLVIFPIVSIMTFHAKRVEGRAINLPEGVEATRTNPDEFPDIYYIFVDAYSRNDWTLQEFGYDNSAFTDALRERGFYVAERSCANYTRTVNSITSALAMDFFDPAGLEELNRREGESYLVTFAEVNNQAAKIAKTLGYSYIHFATGFLTTNRNADADQVIDFGPKGAFIAEGDFRLNFLDVFLPTTMLRPVHQRVPVKSYHRYGYERVLALFEELRTVPERDEPTFTVAHFIKPHFPWSFTREGEIVEKPAGWVAEDDLLAEDRGERYIDQMIYMNGELLELVDDLLENSERTPIIVIQGDHSWSENDRTNPPILNAYLVPEETREQLYPTISPVNSFRLIYDTYWGLDLGLLEDTHYINVTKERPFQFRPLDENEQVWCE